MCDVTGDASERQLGDCVGPVLEAGGPRHLNTPLEKPRTALPWLLRGEEVWILIHIEIQSPKTTPH